MVIICPALQLGRLHDHWRTTADIFLKADGKSRRLVEELLDPHLGDAPHEGICKESFFSPEAIMAPNPITAPLESSQCLLQLRRREHGPIEFSHAPEPIRIL